MKNYSLGFVFSPDLKEVYLIRKNRPAWQAGKLNGIGGEMLPGESITTCMIREAQEETGLETRPDDWMIYAFLHGPDFRVMVSWLRLSLPCRQPLTKTDEEIVLVRISDLENHETIDNVPLLIQAALADMRSKPERGFFLTLDYC